MRLHLDKPGIRALGVAESFRQGQRRSVLAGVVMRSDCVVDGMGFGRTRVGGDDATDSIARLYRRLARNDINLVMVSGAILSLYNIVDVDRLSEKTKLPVVCLTYRETSGIEGAIRLHFPEKAEEKLLAYRKLGKRTGVRLRTGKRVFVRSAGLESRDAGRVLDAFTLQGSVPEPVRVARLLARAAAAR
ncbi:MAG: DUF99 family protein [Nitrososphaerota archaeon]|nr:DUF99 family protein [Nitrososphaerota archaeon]